MLSRAARAEARPLPSMHRSRCGAYLQGRKRGRYRIEAGPPEPASQLAEAGRGGRPPCAGSHGAGGAYRGRRARWPEPPGTSGRLLSACGRTGWTRPPPCSWCTRWCPNPASGGCRRRPRAGRSPLGSACGHVGQRPLSRARRALQRTPPRLSSARASSPQAAPERLAGAVRDGPRAPARRRTPSRPPPRTAACPTAAGTQLRAGEASPPAPDPADRP